VQVNLTVAVLFVQLAPPSPTLAVTVTLTVPALVQTNVGEGELVLLKVPSPVPPVMVQEKLTSAPLPALSTPCAERLTEPPTSTEEGLAESEDTAAQGSTADTPPLMLTDPLLPASTLEAVQTTFNETVVVVPAVTSKVAEPVQGTPLEVVAFSVIT
jgi:hypothetical protein